MLTQVHPAPRRRPNRIRVGLLGHGRAGQAVAQALLADEQIDLRWVARRRLPQGSPTVLPGTEVPVIATVGNETDVAVRVHGRAAAPQATLRCLATGA